MARPANNTGTLMYTEITGTITAELAENETERLFDEPITDLPGNLLARGWKLIIRTPGRMFAVSTQWGGTGTKTNIEDVITEAWGLVGFCEYVNRARAEGRDVEID